MPSLTYNSEVGNVFVQDMEAAGFEVRQYSGRFFWQGPAVNAGDHEEFLAVIRATEVPVQWDNMGKGWIVYPTENCGKPVSHA